MLPQLQRGFEVIECQREYLQTEAGALCDTQWRWKPGATVWSIAQIIEHLVLSDETVGRARSAETVVSEPWMFRAVPRSWRRAWIIKALDRDVTLPLPSPDIVPSGNVPMPILCERWAAARREMRGALEVMNGRENRYSHPVLGPLTAAQMLELGRAHIGYHTRQMEMLQRGAAFPRE